MKTTEDVLNHIISDMNSMIKRPKMWADNPVSLETQYLYMLGLVLFAKEIPTIRIISDWCKFAYTEIGFHGVEPVAVFLRKSEKLDDEWAALTSLLKKFYDYMNVPIV